MHHAWRTGRGAARVDDRARLPERGYAVPIHPACACCGIARLSCARAMQRPALGQRKIPRQRALRAYRMLDSQRRSCRPASTQGRKLSAELRRNDSRGIIGLLDQPGERAMGLMPSIGYRSGSAENTLFLNTRHTVMTMRSAETSTIQRRRRYNDRWIAEPRCATLAA